MKAPTANFKCSLIFFVSEKYAPDSCHPPANQKKKIRVFQSLQPKTNTDFCSSCWLIEAALSPACL